MIKIMISMLLGIVLNNAFSQNTETRSIHELKKLVITGKTFSAQLIKSDENKIEISSSDLTMDKILTTETNGELTISVKGIFTTGNVTCKIFCTKIPSIIEINNGALVKSTETLEIPKILLITNTDGYIHLLLNSENISIQCNTGGDMTLEGTTNILTASANTNATVRVEMMKIDTATVKAYLSAEIHLSAKSSINAFTGTGGKIFIQKPYPANIIEKNETGGQVIRD